MCQAVWIIVCSPSGAPRPSILIVEVLGIVFPYAMSMTFQFQSLLTYILYKTIKTCMNECSNTAILLLHIIIIIIIITISSSSMLYMEGYPKNTQNIHKKLAMWSQRVTSTNVQIPKQNYICSYNLIMHNILE
jgi:hypothetical protein